MRDPSPRCCSLQQPPWKALLPPAQLASVPASNLLCPGPPTLRASPPACAETSSPQQPALTEGTDCTCTSDPCRAVSRSCCPAQHGQILPPQSALLSCCSSHATHSPPAAASSDKAALLASAGTVFHHVVIYVKQGQEVGGHAPAPARLAHAAPLSRCSAALLASESSRIPGHACPTRRRHLATRARPLRLPRS